MRIGPVPCQSCRKPLHWNGFAWIDSIRKGRRHQCERCNAVLGYSRERCARRSGHSTGSNGGGHRSYYAMRNAADRKRKWRLAA